MSNPFTAPSGRGVRGRGPVLGWRLPMTHTDIEGHEIESSRRIRACSDRAFELLELARTI